MVVGVRGPDPCGQFFLHANDRKSTGDIVRRQQQTRSVVARRAMRSLHFQGDNVQFERPRHIPAGDATARQRGEFAELE